VRRDTKGCVLLTHSRLCLDVTDSVYDLLLWCLLLNWSKTSPECCCSQWTQTDLQPALSCAINSVLIRDVQNRFLFLFGFQKNLDERFLSAPWMQTLLVFVTFSLSCAFRGTVSVGKPSEWMSSFWTIHFFKTECELIFGFPHTPYFSVLVGHMSKLSSRNLFKYGVSLFGYVTLMDDSVSAKKIWTVCSPEDWNESPGRTRTTYDEDSPGWP